MKHSLIIIGFMLTACVAPQPPSVTRIVCLNENRTTSELNAFLHEFANENELDAVDRSEVSRTNLLAMGAEFLEGADHDSIVVFLNFRDGRHFLTAGNISLSSKEAFVTTRIENRDAEMLDSLLDAELRDRWHIFQVDDEEVVVYGICTGRLN
ncbi:hypothetical protein [Glycocaulis sp.]|uniref:hypothetical protein n=1 Tax=Glycocaulis sp. TaxID=1969725 RepID=UPI003D1A4204